LRGEENGWGKRKILNLPAVETLALESARTNASAGRERVPPSAEYGRPGGAGWRGGASSSGPAGDGCHCFVPSERGCEFNELGSLRTPPSTSAINAPLPLPRSRCFARSIFDGGGGFAAEGALRLPIRAGGAAGSRMLFFFYEQTPPYPKAAR